MLSKQSLAKESQGYRVKPKWPMCVNCTHFRMDKVPSEWNRDYMLEKNLRCAKGEFATKKTSTCNAHTPSLP